MSRRCFTPFDSQSAGTVATGGSVLCAVRRHVLLFIALGLIAIQSGCNLLPQRLDRPHLHNPFPQLRKVAVLPFFNQSGFPTIDGADVANRYRHQLQQIRGFEVIPVGVVDQYLTRNPVPIDNIPDFQQLARDLGVDAIVVGSITDFDPYYPPRLGLAVRWYAANPGYHPIPPGYGLPWGTAEEEYIPDDLRFEAEFALATEQLKTQTPLTAGAPVTAVSPNNDPAQRSSSPASSPDSRFGVAPAGLVTDADGQSHGLPAAMVPGPDSHSKLAGLPAQWPDPNGFVPDGPQVSRPVGQPQMAPVMELIKQYDGSDSEFTARLESYYAFRDDARFGGWQGYLERSDDFINFCCYLHLSELLTARGGAGYARPTWRWPLATYQP